MSTAPTTSICQYYFNDLASNKIRNLKTNAYDLSLVNVGTASFPTITASSSTVNSVNTFSLFQNTASPTNYSYYVNNTNPSIRALNGSFSVSFWCFIPTTSTFGTVWCLYNDTSSNLITFTQNSNGAPIFSITLNGVRFYVGSNSYALNTYNHLVLTCSTSGTTSTIRFYVNGVLTEYNASNSSGNRSNVTWATNTITMTQLLFDGSNTTLYVLGGPPGTGITWPANSLTASNGFNGFVSQLTIYNSALTQSEVTYLRNNIVTSYVYIPPGENYYLTGPFDVSYVVTSQVKTTQLYAPSCVSSDGKNMISIQGTYPNFSIYYSNNYGATWTLSSVSTSIYATSCSPVNYTNVFYLGSI